MKTLLVAHNYADGRLAAEALPTALREALPDYSVRPVDSLATTPTGASTVRSLRRMSRSFRAADALVLAGPLNAGPNATKRDQAALRNAFVLTCAARATGVPVAVIGASIDSVPGSIAGRTLRQLARMAGLVIVRDRHSARALVKAGVPAPVRVGPDPAWVLLADSPNPQTERPRAVVAGEGRALRSDDLRTIISGLQPAADDGLTVQVQPWEPGPRWASYPRSHPTSLPGPVEWLREPSSLRSAASAFTDAQLVVATDYPALMAAAAAQVRTVAVSRDPALVAAAHDLGIRAMGLSVPPARLQGEVRAALDADDPVSGDVAAARIDGARSGLSLLRMVVSRGHDEPVSVAGLQLEPRI